MKLKNLLLGAVAAVFLTSCGGSSVDMKDPKAVTEGFHNAFGSQDWDGAKALATAKSAESIDAVAGMAEMPGAEKEEPKKVEKVECGEPADHKCDCTVSMEGGETAPYSLVQDGEEWKVEFSKGLGGAMEDMGDAMGDALEEGFEEVMEEGLEELEEGLEDAMEELETAVEEAH